VQRFGATFGVRALLPPRHGAQLCALVLPLVVACGVARLERDTDSEASGPSLLHDGEALGRALSALLVPLPAPIQALSVRVYTDRVVLQVRDAREPARVQQYRLRAGQLSGPIPVELEGPGALEDNLFPLDRRTLELVVAVAARAEQLSGLDRARAVELSLRRNLPASMDVHFEVSITSPGGSRRIEASKDGKISRVTEL
jgi:hypothetical protein